MKYPLFPPLILPVVLPFALIAGSASAQTPQAQSAPRTIRTDAPKIEASKIILVGDSTMAPISGWASAFCSYHVARTIACLNLGRGGRSTRSYRVEGSWDLALAEASVPGYAAIYVLIQFGHNDQNVNPAAWTEMKQEFPDTLRTFVKDVRARGAMPVLVTPLVRRQFRDGTLYNSLAPWSDEVRRVARELQVPLIELNQRSADKVAAMGEDAAEALAQLPRGQEEKPVPPAADSPGPHLRFGRKYDPTHVGDAGARHFAAIVADELVRAVPELQQQIAP